MTESKEWAIRLSARSHCKVRMDGEDVYASREL